MDDVLNTQLLQELRQIMGEEFSTLIDTYESDTLQRLELIEQAIHRSDYEALSSAAHSLKGSSANVGAIRMETLCHHLVDSAKSADREMSAELYPLLKSQFHQLRERFSALR